ncbi:hypothetical protein FQU76_10505 [Streptomyces qinzhouensis]|uniref:DNA primase/polymerase bifunctional N-terminal domain-containing protein n=1 Tax=Streptomyces qinzhouensis TaxID=2599401 RepID=A0A5B8IQG0_9ACTN|nr:hypothetical protein FQU76_10505 [Streptomyces qinzhouensis]
MPHASAEEDRRQESARGAARITAAGADWLAAAGAGPRPQAERCPGAPAVLSCGRLFDVVSAPAVFGRLLLDRMWEEGPGSGPVAAHRGRMLVFTTPGTAARLPALLSWEEWGGFVPALMFHGRGDAVTVPPLAAPGGGDPGVAPRWLVAPGARHPWLPGPEVLLWACVRAVKAARAVAGAVRTGAPAGPYGPISPLPDPGANVYDVSRRR